VDVARDYLFQHQVGFFPRETTDINTEMLENPGEYHYRAGPGAEAHINDPSAIAALQVCVCVCVCVCVYVCILHTYIHMYMHKEIQAYIYVYIVRSRYII